MDRLLSKLSVKITSIKHHFKDGSIITEKMGDVVVAAPPAEVIASPTATTAVVETPDWKTIVAAKKAELHAAIPDAWRIPPALLATVDFSLESTQVLADTPILRDSKILSDRELEITEKYSAADLLPKLAAAEFTALEVAIAFSKRAAMAQQLLSCVTEMFFDRAQERAAFLDDYLAREKKVFGPLHGLPVSIKDSFNIAGIQSSIGFVSFLGRPVPATNGALVDLLLELGAVLYVKTNIPQTLMTADSENNIFGRTRNPHKMNLTAGGSSGGEGSLVAFRGSLIGVGTDIAGSIRIPSLCCGVYGFKPTTSRVPYSGQASPSLAGLPGIAAAAGPLATTMADLRLFFKAVLDGKPWNHDSQATAMPYQQTADIEAVRTKPVLRVGVMPEDPSVLLHPPVRRALDDAVAKLQAAGHEIEYIPFSDYTSVQRGSDLSMSYFAIDPTHTSFKHLAAAGEPLIASLTAEPSESLKKILNREYDIVGFAGLNVERALFQNTWHHIFRQKQLDIVIGPGAQHTAPKHDTYGPPAYTVFWNMLDYPACIIPFGKASKTLDPAESANPAVDNPKYDAEAVDGAPTAVQIVAPQFQDELCLEAAARVDAILNGV